MAHFKAAGWRIRAIAALGQHAGDTRATTLRQFPQAGPHLGAPLGVR
jgi:hypothetical protein